MFDHNYDLIFFLSCFFYIRVSKLLFFKHDQEFFFWLMLDSHNFFSLHSNAQCHRYHLSVITLYSYENHHIFFLEFLFHISQEVYILESYKGIYLLVIFLRDQLLSNLKALHFIKVLELALNYLIKWPYAILFNPYYHLFHWN